ncbi:MAG: NYN domain-containing protein [Coriobacteriales bacterium]|nr:NYN domain-containing protein [Coriobacteriales bacterium]
MAEEAHSLAVFIDFENVALGAERPNVNGRRRRTTAAPKKPEPLDMKRILERLVEKGKIVSKRAYADWSRFGDYVGPMHELGIELTEIPVRGMTGKNSADIRLAVDAMELSHAKEHIDTFVIVSGDSDFTPLVSKLKENGKIVVGVGMRDSTSDLLAANCDEFIYYEDIGMTSSPSIGTTVPSKKKPAFQLLFETIEALQRENVGAMHSSLVKDTMRRKQPQFSESSYGYRSFSQMLEDAQQLGFITLRTDTRSGTYVVEGFSR